MIGLYTCNEIFVFPINKSKDFVFFLNHSPLSFIFFNKAAYTIHRYLIMPNVNSGMEFTYSARNAVGAPFFERAPSIIIQPDGSILFECLCNANPQPTVKWILKDPKGDRELTGDKYVSKVKKQVGKYAVTLIVKNPTQQDQGIYKVVAVNPQGTHTVEQNFTLKCTAKDVFKPIDSYI